MRAAGPQASWRVRWGAARVGSWERAGVAATRSAGAWGRWGVVRPARPGLRVCTSCTRRVANRRGGGAAGRSLSHRARDGADDQGARPRQPRAPGPAPPAAGFTGPLLLSGYPFPPPKGSPGQETEPRPPAPPASTTKTPYLYERHSPRVHKGEINQQLTPGHVNLGRNKPWLGPLVTWEVRRPPPSSILPLTHCFHCLRVEYTHWPPHYESRPTPWSFYR